MITAAINNLVNSILKGLSIIDLFSRNIFNCRIIMVILDWK